jgi:uroporphyrinogen decarboxylase
VPINYIANPEIDQGLWQHFGLAAGDREGLFQALGVDFRGVGPGYVGPPMPDLGPDRHQGLWGTRMKRISHGTGEYWDYCEWLLKDADTVEEIDAFPWHPSPDHFDYSSLPAQIEHNRGYCVWIGGAGTPDLLNGSGMVRTMERVLLDLALEEPALMRLFDLRTQFHVEFLARCLEAGQGKIDLVWMGDDFGSQRGPLISMATFRKHIRPRHQQVIDVVKSYGLPILFHSCGSTRRFMPDLIEMGVDVMDTLQPEAAEMDPAELKAEFGDRLAFHGMISTAGAVAAGSVADTVAEVTERLETMMPGGGYLLAPTHALQSNSPIENVVAMYDTARRVGVYN